MRLTQIPNPFKDIDVPTVGTPPININSENLSLGDIVSALLVYIFPLAGLLLLVYLIFAGFQYMTSGGDPKKIEMAKQRLTSGIIGFIVVFISYWLVQLVAKVLGLTKITETFPG